MQSLLTFLSLVGLSLSSAAILSGDGALPPPVVPEPRQAVPPVVPEPRQSNCQYSLNFTSVGQQAQLRSPNYPAEYPPNSNCKYSVRSPVGSQVQLSCSEFNVESTNACQYDKFSLSLSEDSTSSVYCGNGVFNTTSVTNVLTVAFISDSSNYYSTNLYRFSCVLTVIGSTGPTTTTPKPTTTTRAPVAPTAAAASSTSCSCGFRNEAPRIVGGVNAVVNEFPWRCNLYSPNMGVFCGATVISSQWILTAAHCSAPALKELQAGRLYVDCGDHDLTVTTESANQMNKVLKIVQNANYNNQTQDNDIALLQLESPLKLDRTVQPICLPWNLIGNNLQGATVVASGWGTTSSGGSQSMTLQKVDLPLLTTQQCRAYYGTSVTDNMICTYNPGKDTCQGDSGGSIDYKDPNTGRYYGVGVVSWGVGCAGTNQPGVYSYVNNYLSWIQTQTGESFCKA